MPRDFTVGGIMLHANATPCFHHCRYCQLRTSKAYDAAFPRFQALVERFIDWREATGRSGFGIWPWYGNSHDHDLEAVAGLRRIGERLGCKHDVVLLGGVAHRPMDEMRSWFEQRRPFGIDTVVATFSGHERTHDFWNNMDGNYRFQMDCLHLAADVGLKTQQRVLLLRDGMAGLERLFDDLDAIRPHSHVRWAIPLFYSGLAKRLEDQRLTENDFASLAPRIRASLRKDSPKWRTERDWVDRVLSGREPEDRELSLSLGITDKTLEWAEARSCGAIVDELEEKSRAAYAAMPSRHELCERYGDPDGDKVYMLMGQMEHLWVDRYLKDSPGAFDIRATRFG